MVDEYYLKLPCLYLSTINYCSLSLSLLRLCVTSWRTGCEGFIGTVVAVAERAEVYHFSAANDIHSMNINFCVNSLPFIAYGFRSWLCVWGGHVADNGSGAAYTYYTTDDATRRPTPSGSHVKNAITPLRRRPPM